MKKFEYNGKVVLANTRREAAKKIMAGAGRRVIAGSESKPWALSKDQVAKAQAKVSELFSFLKSNGMQLCYDYEGGPLFYVASADLEGCDAGRGKDCISEQELDEVISTGSLDTDEVWFSSSDYRFKYNGKKATASARIARAGRRIKAGSELSADTVIVGTIALSKKSQLEKAFSKVKKAYPGLESYKFGNTITLRGKLADVFGALTKYGDDSISLHENNGDSFLPNSIGADLDYDAVERAAGSVTASARRLSRATRR